MTLLSDTLATELKKLTLYSTETPAIAAWAEAFAKYFEGAQSNAVPIATIALVPAKAAFIGAATGLSLDAATKLQAAITAFWGAIVPATAWATVTAIAPPGGLASISQDLKGIDGISGVFGANTAGKLDKNDSMTAIATAIHSRQSGGTATWPLPTPGIQPIT